MCIRDSYTPYDELDSKIKDIMDHQTNNLYMSYESTGLSTDGKDIMEVIVARDKAVVDNYMTLLQRAQTDPEAVAADVKSGKLADYQTKGGYYGISDRGSDKRTVRDRP